MYCDNCGKELPDDSDFCTECGTRLTKSPNFADETDMFDMSDASLENVPKESRKKSTVIVGVIAVLVFALLIITVLVKLLKGDGPASKLVHGAQKTVFSEGAEFTIKISSEDETAKIKGFYTIDSKDENAVLYCKYEDEDGIEECAWIIDNGRLGFYDYVEKRDSTEASNEKIPKSVDTELIFQLVAELGKKDIEKLDFEEYLDELDLLDTVEDYIEPKDIDKAVAAVLKALDKNAEDCLGVEKDGKTYTYKIDIYDTLMVCLDAVEKYAADEDEFEDLRDEIEDNKKYIKGLPDIEFEVTYDGKYISEIKFSSNSFFMTGDVTITFENVGKCDETLDKGIRKAISEAEE